MKLLRIHALLALAVGLLAVGLIGGCASEGRNTQVLVTVDAEDGVQGMANTLVVRVYGGPLGESLPSTVVLERPFDVGAGQWPRTVALAPRDRDVMRLYRFEASAYREGNPGPSATPVATVRLISGYASDQTLRVRLLLQDACLGQLCTPDTTCDRGTCIDATVPTDQLGDAGIGPMDGGAGCTSNASCDDGASCTEDVCMADGSCDHRPTHAMCDDGELCTDDSCVGVGGAAGTGCRFAPNTLGCDDGVFCNGADVCAGGVCTHPGSPCGALTCREDPAGCTGCTLTTDCPAASTGPFGACGGLTDSCDETGTQTATRTTYECISTVCEPTTEPVSQACTRPTEGDPCGASTYGDWTPCTFPSQCTLSGSRTRIRSDFECASGACTTAPLATETEACTRPDERFACSDGNACTSPDTCSGGSCVPGPSICGGCTSASQCDDGIGCTVDECISNACSNTPADFACSPPFGCGTAYCHPSLDCQYDYSACDECWTDDQCADGDPCNVDYCNTARAPNACEHYPGTGCADGGVDAGRDAGFDAGRDAGLDGGTTTTTTDASFGGG